MIIAFAGALPGAAACLGLALVVIALRPADAAGRRLGEPARSAAGGLLHDDDRAVEPGHRGPYGAAAGEWLGLPRTVQGQALIVVRLGGEAVPPLLTDSNADFLGRSEAFDRAADTIEAWDDEYRLS